MAVCQYKSTPCNNECHCEVIKLASLTVFIILKDCCTHPNPTTFLPPGLSFLSIGSFIGIVLLRAYLPRLDKPYITRIR